jgi:hypothetical protein
MQSEMLVVGAGNSMAGAGTGGVVDSEQEWDEDDVMMYLWGNSRASGERHEKKKMESAQSVEWWRDGVVSISPYLAK